jgi:hypothetical protein
MLRSLRRTLDENDILLDELPGGSKDAGRRAQDAQQRREKRTNESAFIIAMRSSSVPDIARSA